jgi:protein-S-isoprenylcysteine O-methyltransferase Ste14
MLHALLITGIWIAWVAYWFWAARRTKPTVRKESGLSRAANVVPLTLAVVLMALPNLWHGWPSAVIVPRSLALYWAGVAVLITGLGFSVAARRFLGANWSGTVTLKQGHELIRNGPYRFVRHPIYTGILLGFIGSAISLDEIRGVVAVGLVIVAFLIKIRLEERWMIETFGDAYRHYRTEVRALIPFVI